VPRKAFLIAFDETPAEPELHAAVQQVDVEENAALPTTFAFRVRLSRDRTGQWKGTDDDRFSLFTKVSIDAGAVGDSSQAASLEPIAEGYVTAVGVHIGAQPDDAYLEVRGMDATALMSVEEKTVSWPNMADSDIVQQIVSTYGIPLQATSTTPVRQQNDTLLIQRGTDARFLRLLARRNGFEFSFSKERGAATTCYFGPPRVSGTPQADLAIQFGEQSSLASFDVTAHGLRPLAVATTQVDIKTKNESTANVTASQLNALGSSGLSSLIESKLDSLVNPLEQQGRLLLLAQPSADAAELQSIAQAVRDEAEWLIAARGEVNTDAYGTVLRAGRLVLIKGAGKQHSGAYYVTRVRHLIKNNGTHVQTFEARRNARDVTGSERFADAAAFGVPAA